MSSRRKFVTNFVSLSGLQLTNYVLPLVTVPYIVRVVGAETYGLINFAQALIAYFILFVNYGFDLSIPREIGQYRNDKERLSGTVSVVFWAKVLLFAASVIVFAMTLLLVPRLNKDSFLYLLTFSSLVGFVFFPTWLFQGLEKLNYTAGFNFVIKLLFTIGIFLVLKERTQYLVIPLFLSLGQIVVGILAFLYALRVFDLKLQKVKRDDIVRTLREAGTVFRSTVVLNLYTTSNIFILGLFATDRSVGLYAAGAKLMAVIQALVHIPMSQTLYPYFGRMFQSSKEDAIVALRKVVVWLGLGTLLISVFVFAFSEVIIVVLFGEDFIDAVIVLQIMAAIPFIYGLSYTLGLQGILSQKLDKQFFRIAVLSSIINLGLNLLLTPILFERGTAIAWVATEALIVCAYFYTLMSVGINVLPQRTPRSM